MTPIAAPEEPFAAPDSRARILVVDDEPVNLQVLRQVLQPGSALFSGLAP